VQFGLEIKAGTVDTDILVVADLGEQFGVIAAAGGAGAALLDGGAALGFVQGVTVGQPGGGRDGRPNAGPALRARRQLAWPRRGELVRRTSAPRLEWRRSPL